MWIAPKHEFPCSTNRDSSPELFHHIFKHTYKQIPLSARITNIFQSLNLAIVIVQWGALNNPTVGRRWRKDAVNFRDSFLSNQLSDYLKHAAHTPETCLRYVEVHFFTGDVQINGASQRLQRQVNKQHCSLTLYVHMSKV